jgi:hypothetical protein
MGNPLFARYPFWSKLGSRCADARGAPVRKSPGEALGGIAKAFDGDPSEMECNGPDRIDDLRRLGDGGYPDEARWGRFEPHLT